MKKLILLLTLVVAATTVYSQDTTNIENITEAERLIDKYSGKIFESFREFITNASPTIKEGFGWIVKLQISKGIGLLLVPLIGLITTRFSYKFYKKRESREDIYEMLGIIGLVVGILVMAIGCFTLYNGLLHIMAPEWYAIKELMETFK